MTEEKKDEAPETSPETTDREATLVERLEQIAIRASKLAGPDGRDVTEAERDEMWTRF